jgi:hypothetical protein
MQLLVTTPLTATIPLTSMQAAHFWMIRQFTEGTGWMVEAIGAALASPGHRLAPGFHPSTVGDLLDGGLVRDGQVTERGAEFYAEYRGVKALIDAIMAGCAAEKLGAPIAEYIAPDEPFTVHDSAGERGFYTLWYDANFTDEDGARVGAWRFAGFENETEAEDDVARAKDWASWRLAQSELMVTGWTQHRAPGVQWWEAAVEAIEF